MSFRRCSNKTSSSKVSHQSKMVSVGYHDVRVVFVLSEESHGDLGQCRDSQFDVQKSPDLFDNLGV